MLIEFPLFFSFAIRVVKEKKRVFDYQNKTIGKMSQVFEGYERQYCEISANLTRKCASAGLLNGGDSQFFCVF